MTTKRMLAACVTVIGLMSTMGVGCATTTTAAGVGSEARLETRTLARGVTLTVSDEAGPEARHLADELQAEMRQRYINAR